MGSEPLSLDQFEWHTISAASPTGDTPVNTNAFDLPPLLALPQSAESAWELTAFYSPMAVGEPPRPYYPKMALGVDATTGMILAFQLAPPDQTMGQAAARALIQSIQASGYRPAVIKLDSINLMRALEPLAKALGAEVRQAKSLPMVNEARRSLERFSKGF